MNNIETGRVGWPLKVGCGLMALRKVLTIAQGDGKFLNESAG